MTCGKELIKIIENLQLNKDKWPALDSVKKIFYLQSAMDKLLIEAKNWAESSAMAKGINVNSQLIAQEWLNGPCSVMRELRILISTLLNLNDFKTKNIIKTNERLIAKIFPMNMYESILFRNFEGEIWIEKGKPASTTKLYKHANKKGSICLVLGAGNVSSIAPLDAIYKLYNEGVVCLVKLNPVNDYLFDILNKVFSELIQDGFLNFMKGDNEISALLCENEMIDEIHITGSHNTHDTIVWGRPELEETKLRKEKNTPKLNKKITSELGCVTPLIIIPGVWTDEDLKFQVKHVVSAIENNGSFNCNAAKVLVLCKQWPQRNLFLNYLRLELKKCPAREAYYPGAKVRYEQFLKNYPQAEILGEIKENCLPWTLIPDVEAREEEFALNIEAFCGVIAEVSLDAENPGDFMHKATNFCNDSVWGTLSCSVFIEPTTEKIYRKEFEQTLSMLRYGAIGINCWAAVCYGLGVMTWGAFPGHTLQDIRSGIGTVHNVLMYDYPEKSILRAPFRIWPRPVWFYDNKNAKEIAQRLFKFEYSQSGIDFLKLLYSAVKG